MSPEVGLPLLIAFGGGMVSFASPCVLPLVPVYLCLISGFDIRSAGSQGRSLAMVGDTALFVAGFSVVFVMLGSTASVVGRAVLVNHLLLTEVAGGLIVAMAAFLAASQLFGAPLLYREWRLHPQTRGLGFIAAPVAGAAFGLGWTPCIGPILASVLSVAATQGEAAKGAVLLGAYSLGLGVPFLVAGLLLTHSKTPLLWLRGHSRSIAFGSATLMAVLGALLLSGQLSLIDSMAGSL